MVKHKKFNTAGVFVPALHYMVDISHTVNEIIEKYIVINISFVAAGDYFASTYALVHVACTKLSSWDY